MGGMGKGKKNKKGRKVGMLRPKEKKTEGRLRQFSSPDKKKIPENIDQNFLVATKQNTQTDNKDRRTQRKDRRRKWRVNKTKLDRQLSPY